MISAITKNINFGLRLKEERNRLGLTQKELAGLLGIKPLTLLQYEKGNSSPTILNAYSLQILGFNLDYMFNGNNQTNVVNKIDFDLLRQIKYQVLIARSAIIDSNMQAFTYFMATKDNLLLEMKGRDEIVRLLNSTIPTDDDWQLTLQLYNNHLSLGSIEAILINTFDAAIDHFRLKKSTDGLTKIIKTTIY